LEEPAGSNSHQGIFQLIHDLTSGSLSTALARGSRRPHLRFAGLPGKRARALVEHLVDRLVGGGEEPAEQRSRRFCKPRSRILTRFCPQQPPAIAFLRGVSFEVQLGTSAGCVTNPARRSAPWNLRFRSSFLPREQRHREEEEEEERIHGGAGPVGDAEAQQEEGAQGEEQRHHDVTNSPAETVVKTQSKSPR